MREIRISIAVIVTFLISIGIVMIYSSSGIYALKEYGTATYFVHRHIIFVLFGCALMTMVMMFDYRVLSKYAKPLILFTIFLLVIVLIPSIGKESFGARRWFHIGPFNFQPVEFAKIAVLIYTADYLARKRNKITYFWKGFAPIMMVLIVICFLLINQPDLGSVVLLSSVVLLLLFIAGGKLSHLITLVLLAMPVLYFLVWSVTYRRNRILAFLDPFANSQGIGFQLSQSQIALGSGGLFGVGLGKSVQKLFYLPAAHTDFIFSIIGEELGLLGTLSVILLFAAFIWQGARICKRTVDPFGYYLSMGIVAMISLQTVVNIGVSIGALPTKGLPLPFVSYGGSALLFNMVSVGLLLNISRIEDL
jgi:cell division protein FtsW